MKSPAGLTRFEVIGSITVILLVLAIFCPIGGHGIDPSRKSQAKNDVTQIVTAVKSFVTEYGHYPTTSTNGKVDAELVSVLVGSNQTLNPRKIVFIDIEPAKKGKSGLRDGAFVDPWGGPYYIATPNGTNITITAGTNQVTLRKSVAVWNDPSLQPDSASLSDAKKSRRYVTSWE